MKLVKFDDTQVVKKAFPSLAEQTVEVQVLCHKHKKEQREEQPPPRIELKKAVAVPHDIRLVGKIETDTRDTPHRDIFPPVYSAFKHTQYGLSQFQYRHK